MSEAPAGWYPQPDGTQRYWDGSAWTEHISGTPGATDAVSAAPAESAVAASDHATTSDAVEATASRQVVSEFGVTPSTAPASSTAPGPAAPIGAPTVMASGQYSGVTDDVYAATGVAPSTRKVWPIVLGVVLGIVAIVALAIVVIALLINNVTKGPEATAQSLFTAWQTQDCAAEHAATAPGALGTVEDFCATVDYSWVDDMEDWTIDITGTTVTNDTAVVATTETYTWQGEGEPVTETWEYYFELFDGEWFYVDSAQV